MKILLCGDIHGDMKFWKKLIEETDCDMSIVVGDFGAGFIKVPDENKVPLKHKFIRGNHDNPQACKDSSRWIPDGTYWPDLKMMFVGGAWSIDKDYRTPFIDWWPDEELSYEELENMIDQYLINKPEIMITHDCPHSIAEKLFKGMSSYPIKATRTSYALDVMLKGHRPKMWGFGHWHESKNKSIDGTQFICLDINQTAEMVLTKGNEND